MPPVSAYPWLFLGLLLAVVHLTAVAFSNALRSYSRSRLEQLCQDRGHARRAEEVFRLDVSSETAIGLIEFISGLILAVILGVLLVLWKPSWLVYFSVATAVVLGGLGHLAASVYGRVLAEDLLDRGWPVATALRRIVSPITLVAGYVESTVERRIHGRDWSRIGPRPASVEVEIHVKNDEEATNLDAELPASTRTMLENAVSLIDLDAAALMTPRSAMVSLPASAQIQDAARLFAMSGLSRIPIYGEHRDDIVGLLYAKDLLPLLLDTKGQTQATVRKLARPPYLIPETKNAAELLDDLRQQRVQIAIVVDEYGSVSGLITLEDLLEQIVGRIDDEHDVPTRDESIIDFGNDRYEIDGSTDIEEINERLDLDLPTNGDYQTVGGLAFHVLGRVPEAGETFRASNVDFTVLEVGDHAVRRLSLCRRRGTDPENGSAHH